MSTNDQADTEEQDPSTVLIMRATPALAPGHHAIPNALGEHVGQAARALVLANMRPPYDASEALRAGLRASLPRAGAPTNPRARGEEIGTMLERFAGPIDAQTVVLDFVRAAWPGVLFEVSAPAGRPERLGGPKRGEIVYGWAGDVCVAIVAGYRLPRMVS